MNRREFLAGAGAAFWAPPAPTGTPRYQWVRQTPDAAADVCTFAPGVEPASLPADLSGVPDFLPPSHVKTEKRRLWSELKKHSGYLAKLRRGYDALLNDSSKSGLAGQAALHAFYCTGRWRPPGSSLALDVHSCWLFLPWHRAFIYFHERKLQAALRDRHFRLPVWDWDNDPSVPEFYRDLGVPSFVTGNCGRATVEGSHYTDPCLLQAWLWSSRFEDFLGGPPPASQYAPVHAGQANSGPHTSVHNMIVGGAMSRAEVAAADPVFYSHHANMDRFFSRWMREYPAFAGDAMNTAAFMQSPLYFYDENDRLVRVRPADLMDEQRLGYQYDLPSNRSGLQGLERHGLEELATSGEVCVPGQIRLRHLDTATIVPGEYYLLVLRSGAMSANVGSFGVFAHHHDAPVEVAVAAVIPRKVTDLVRNARENPAQPLILEYGRLDRARSISRDFQSFTALRPMTPVSVEDFDLALLQLRRR